MVSLSHSLLKNATSPFYTLAIKLLNDITGERQALRLFALLNQRPYNTYALVRDFPTPCPALLYNWSLIKVPHSNNIEPPCIRGLLKLEQPVKEDYHQKGTL